MLFLETKGYGYSKRLCKDVVCWFLSKYLSRYKLDIQIVHRSLKSENALGYCDIFETYRPRSFLIEIDTYLNKETYVRTLLHELYHMQDFCLGNLKIKSSKRYYKEECVDYLEYWQQGHEIMAHWHENILLQQYLKDKCLTHL